MSRGLLIIGGLLLGSASGAQAAVNVYYIDAQTGSLAGGRVGGVDQDTLGPSYTDGFGSTTTPEIVTTSFAFNHTSEVNAPASAVGVNGLAYAQGLLNTTITSSSFSAAGRGYVEADWDPNGPASDAHGEAGAALSLNFQVPTDATDLYLLVNGSASTHGYGELVVRLSEQGNSTDLINISYLDYPEYTNVEEPISKTWDNQLYTLTAGALYALDLYANAPSSMAFSSEDLPGFYSSEGQFNLSFSIVPEPSLMLTLLGSSVLLVRRRRAKRS